MGFWLFYLLLMTFYVYFFSKGCSSITFELFMALDPMTGYFRPLDGYFRPLDGYFRPLDFAHAWTNWFCTHEQLLMHEYPYMSSCSWVSFLLHMRRGTWVAVHEYDGFLSKATHAFWVSHVVICCSWTFMFF